MYFLKIMMFLRLFLSIYVIFLVSIHRCIAEIATFSRLQERVIFCDGVVFAHGFFDWVTVATLGLRTGA